MLKNGIYNDDCLKLFPELEDKSIDLILTDVPYGVDFAKGKKYDDSKEYVFSNHIKWLSEMYRVLKDGNHCYIFIPTLEADKWISGVKEVWFRLYNLLATRAYTNSTYLNNNFKFDNQLVIYCAKWTAKKLNKVDWIPTSESWLKDKRNKNPKPYTYSYPSFLNMFSNRKANAHLKNTHWNEKSIDFCSHLIDLSSNPWDIVLDPFSWSGTTLISAKQLWRNYIGFEKEEEFYANIQEQLKILDEGKKISDWKRK